MLQQQKELFLTAFVPGTGPFYDTYALLYQDPQTVSQRVDALLQLEPLYHAMATAPDMGGFAALVSEIGKAVEQGRSPPGLATMLLAASATIEAEVKGKPHALDWQALAGLDGDWRGEVAVLGQVLRPGRFPLETANTRLTDMLANAGGGIPLTVGFTISGGPKNVLVRGLGPTLSAVGVTGVLPAHGACAVVVTAGARIHGDAFEVVAASLQQQAQSIQNIQQNGQAELQKLLEPVAMSEAYVSEQVSDKKIGITGMCRGGRTVWMYTAHSPKIKAGVSWYGGLNPMPPAMPDTPMDVADGSRRDAPSRSSRLP